MNQTRELCSTHPSVVELVLGDPVLAGTGNRIPRPVPRDQDGEGGGGPGGEVGGGQGQLHLVLRGHSDHLKL